MWRAGQLSYFYGKFQPLSSIKKLASQTAIYGLSSILGRLLNFALTPLHTEKLDQASYGVNTDIYSMVAFLMVILTFGMETAFFRFFNKEEHRGDKVFSAAVAWVAGLALLFIGGTAAFLQPFADLLRYEGQPQFILWMMLIVSCDALAAVPFAKLRAENKPFRFLFIRLSTIVLMVLLNLVFFLLFPYMLKHDIASDFVNQLYDPSLGVAYIFIANLVGNIVMILLFLPELVKVRLNFSRDLLFKMLAYSSPLVLAGLAGIANEMANRQFLKFLLPENEFQQAMGIFGANVKIATFMMLFIQAFRFAAEPFFFSGEGNFKDKMSRVMQYFVILQTAIFVGLVSFLDIIKWFIDEKFWVGLDIVPIMIFANLLLGINFNLNIWYKLKNKTRMGAYITFVGLFFTVVTNLILVPLYSYLGAAISTLISYAAMTAYSYYLNQKHDRMDYPLKKIGGYIGLSVLLVYIAYYLLDSNIYLAPFCFIAFIGVAWWYDGRALLQNLRKR